MFGVIHVIEIALLYNEQYGMSFVFSLGTRRCCDVESTSMTLIQHHNNVVCPVGFAYHVFNYSISPVHYENGEAPQLTGLPYIFEKNFLFRVYIKVGILVSNKNWMQHDVNEIITNIPSCKYCLSWVCPIVSMHSGSF